ncbi:hypothetical protein BS47DRAFT_1357493 [Hydnum rufescens UP504]|uniref:Uncharacterized protein n=1 Tax=Hydnum rufescens UP504 TaxID=1448309 RepID=A0A9P6BA09_9AGAM|nr:hypothetical protein BS47DRAFT_1357493 [Hydnum rufescens UP504]
MYDEAYTAPHTHQSRSPSRNPHAKKAQTAKAKYGTTHPLWWDSSPCENPSNEDADKPPVWQSHPSTTCPPLNMMINETMYHTPTKAGVPSLCETHLVKIWTSPQYGTATQALHAHPPNMAIDKIMYNTPTKVGFPSMHETPPNKNTAKDEIWYHTPTVAGHMIVSSVISELRNWEEPEGGGGSGSKGLVQSVGLWPFRIARQCVVHNLQGSTKLQWRSFPLGLSKDEREKKEKRGGKSYDSACEFAKWPKGLQTPLTQPPVPLAMKGCSLVSPGSTTYNTHHNPVVPWVKSNLYMVGHQSLHSNPVGWILISVPTPFGDKFKIPSTSLWSRPTQGGGCTMLSLCFLHEQWLCGSHRRDWELKV